MGRGLGSQFGGALEINEFVIFVLHLGKLGYSQVSAVLTLPSPHYLKLHGQQ